jgi:26 proteasome complex subunit DSS1
LVRNLFFRDDEFEEFPAEDWQPSREELKRAELWDKNWDDDNVNDPIGQQLREELPKIQQQQQ